MATVALEGISKYFGTVPAVQDLSCTIAQGEFLALLGPSGCGKTTTLLMLAGIYRPARGVLRFDGRIVNDLPPRQRNIGMVFQSYALYPHLTVYENLAFPLRVQRQASAVIQHKVVAGCSAGTTAGPAAAQTGTAFGWTAAACGPGTGAH